MKRKAKSSIEEWVLFQMDMIYEMDTHTHTHSIGARIICEKENRLTDTNERKNRN